MPVLDLAAEFTLHIEHIEWFVMEVHTNALTVGSAFQPVVVKGKCTTSQRRAMAFGAILRGQRGPH